MVLKLSYFFQIVHCWSIITSCQWYGSEEESFLVNCMLLKPISCLGKVVNSLMLYFKPLNMKMKYMPWIAYILALIRLNDVTGVELLGIQNLKLGFVIEFDASCVSCFDCYTRKCPAHCCNMTTKNVYQA